MLGTRVDEIDAPRLIRSTHGWWFLGNQTWTLLKSEQVLQDGTICAEIEEFLHSHGAYRPRIPSAYTLTVLPTTTCNLGCGYCFQNTGLDPAGGNKPQRIDGYRLDTATIDRIAHFTESQMERAGLRSLDLVVFGGEPLLNPRGCLALLQHCGTIGLRSAVMTTNGVLLTPTIAKNLNAAGLSGVQVTFDGSREDHDRIRVTRNGGATFDTIVRNVARATDVTTLSWGLRVNISHHNFDRIGEVFAQWKEHLDPGRCTVSFAWVGDAGFGYGNDLRHVDEVSQKFVEWQVMALECGFRITRPGMKTTCHTCSAPGGKYGAVVNADGTLYSCWQSAGKDGFEVGTLDDGYLTADRVSDRWVQCGYEYDQAPTEVVADFHDRVDGQVLDYLYATGRL
ncbi:radical SAM protein [Kitasatospora sp. NPDC004614]|uniref:radical SAM protein n=1 Tax=unclassified Kitasatospora TaxID=2633591 RepID=UPI00369D0868